MIPTTNLYRVFKIERQMRPITMNAKRPLTAFLVRLLLVLFLSGCLPVAVFAQTGSGTTPPGTPGASQDSNEGTAWDIRKNYFKRYKWAEKFGPSTAGGYDVVDEQGNSTGPGQIKMNTSGPAYKWPKEEKGDEYVTLPTKRDEAIGQYMVKTSGSRVSHRTF